MTPSTRACVSAAVLAVVAGLAAGQAPAQQVTSTAATAPAPLPGQPPAPKPDAFQNSAVKRAELSTTVRADWATKMKSMTPAQKTQMAAALNEARADLGRMKAEMAGIESDPPPAVDESALAPEMKPLRGIANRMRLYMKAVRDSGHPERAEHLKQMAQDRMAAWEADLTAMQAQLSK